MAEFQDASNKWIYLYSDDLLIESPCEYIANTIKVYSGHRVIGGHQINVNRGVFDTEQECYNDIIDKGIDAGSPSEFPISI